MSLTPNYGMTIPASTDTVNLLTQNYPNFNILDTALKNVSDSAITVAVETKVGTVHNLVRSDSDRAVLRFTATSDYIAGDTFTVDGNAVTVVTPGGTSIPDRGFVINSNVVGVLVGAVLTLLVGGGLSSVDASDVDYDNTVSGLTATDVQSAIDEVVADIPTGFSASAITYDNTGSGLTATDVQDAIDELANKVVEYSTTETVVGKWVDGSTIYRKCFEGSGSFTSMITIDGSFTPSNTRVVNWAGSWDGNNQNNPFLSTYTGTGSLICDPLIQTNGLKLNISNLTVTHYILIIDYVKLI